MNFKILVASHKDYIGKTNIIENIKNTNTPDDKIVYVVSGSNQKSDDRFLHSTRNFWEYNALLTATEYKNAPEYWLLIHDTVLFGNKFWKKVSSIEFDNDYDVVSINPDNQFNIGFYKHSFLLDNKEYLSSLQGITKEEGIKIEVESRIKNRSNNTSHLINHHIHTRRKFKVWGEIEREEFYIRPLDLYKYLVYVGGSPSDKSGVFKQHPEKP